MQKEDPYSQLFDIQRELISAQNKVKFYESTAVTLKRNSDRCAISIKEIDGLKEEIKTYKPVGKAFVLKAKDGIKVDLLATIDNNEKEIQEQAKYRHHFAGKCKELEKQLKEMVQTLKA